MNSAVVLGLSRSGIAAAKLLKEKGCCVFGVDDNRAALDSAVRDGLVSVGSIDNVDLAVISPGFPLSHSVVKRLMQRGVEVIGETELAYRDSNCKIVAVTGTNGKSTVCSLLGEMLRHDNGFICGNFGIPFSACEQRKNPEYTAIIELSSFQLATMKSFACDVCTVLNISPDHLDVHKSFDEYASVKLSLYNRLREGGKAAIPLESIDCYFGESDRRAIDITDSGVLYGERRATNITDSCVIYADRRAIDITDSGVIYGDSDRVAIDIIDSAVHYGGDRKAIAKSNSSRSCNSAIGNNCRCNSTKSVCGCEQNEKEICNCKCNTQEKDNCNCKAQENAKCKAQEKYNCKCKAQENANCKAQVKDNRNCKAQENANCKAQEKGNCNCKTQKRDKASCSDGEDYIIRNCGCNCKAQGNRYRTSVKNAYRTSRQEPDCTIKENWVCFRGQRVVSLEKFKLLGDHNRSNFLAAVCLAKLMGVANEHIAAAVGFKGLSHRLEYVATVGGVDFIDDSKATNTDSAIKDISAVGVCAVILGGSSKNEDFCDLFNAIRGCYAVIVGDNAKLVSDAEKVGFCDYAVVSNMREAVQVAYQNVPGGKVLLAPSCASFDLYSDYAERGDRFKSEVNRLAER